MQTRSRSAADIMSVSPIIPVIEIEHVDQAVPLANALIAGGINILEITLRTPAALEAIRLLATEVPAAIVGAGTVLNPTDLDKVKAAGASFAISPGMTEALLTHAREQNITLIPGISTGSELMQGLDLGYTHFKLFPATSVGGVSLLKSFAGPFQAARFCPTGGINEGNYQDFLALDNTLCVGGSWVAPKKLMQANDYAQITEVTARALSNIT